MTRPVTVDGSPAWIKRYPRGHRRARLALLDGVARQFELWPLRPPPHRGGAGSRAVEAKRIRQLRSQQIRVPEILAESNDSLVLSDIGHTLSSQMRACAEDKARLDALVATAARAISQAHSRGAYLGQPWPRNLTLQEGEIGFIDFEEDPLEVMELHHAQARDWLLFVFGTARFYLDRPGALVPIVRQALGSSSGEALASARSVAVKLHPVTRLFARLGRSGKVLSSAIRVVRSATLPMLIILGLCLGVDWIGDGELDLLELL